MKSILLVLSFCAMLFCGCSKAVKETQLFGVWKQNPQSLAFAGTLHWIKLNSDKTFEMKLARFSDMIDAEPVPCPNNHTDFVKGTYQFNDGKISFSGAFCDENFSQIQPNCRGEDSYQEFFSVTFEEQEMVFDIEKQESKQIWLRRQ